jgi:hypothetical protein
VIEQGGQDGAIADALEDIVGRRIEQLTSLRIAEGRCAASLLLEIGRLTPSTGLSGTALRSQR